MANCSCFLADSLAPLTFSDMSTQRDNLLVQVGQHHSHNDYQQHDDHDGRVSARS